VTRQPSRTGRDRAATEAAHILSFDVEEYFQVEAAAHSIRRDQWSTFAGRAEPCVDLVLDLLDRHQASATFFVLGWVAEHQPAMVRRIADAGHEIASHGMTHAMLDRLAPEELRRELDDSRKLLEDLGGRPVSGYRAPTFSITHQTAWALDALCDAGFDYDSSVFPVHHDRYGVPEAPPAAHRAVAPSGRAILELPPLTMRLLGQNVPMGGGGYLRLLPARLVAQCLRSWGRRGRIGMIYLHPWELDPGQPALPVGRLRRWRHRLGLSTTQAKLTWLLQRFRFTSVRQSYDALQGAAQSSFAYGVTR